MQVAQAYDPDHVFLLEASAKVWAETSPGFMASIRPEGKGGVIFDEGVAADHALLYQDAGLRAVDTLLQACSIMRMSVSEGWESSRGNTIEVSNGVAGVPDSAGYLAADLAWKGDEALFTAALTGISVSNSERQVPAEDELLSWLLNPKPENAPSGLLYGPGLL